MSGSDDDTARLLDVASGKEVMKPIELDSPIWAVEFSPDGETIVTGAEDSTLQFWKLIISGTRATLHNHFVLRISDGPVWWLRFQRSASGVSLGIASQDRTIRILHMGELQTLFANPINLENDAEHRSGLIIGKGPGGGPEVVSIPAPAASEELDNTSALSTP